MEVGMDETLRIRSLERIPSAAEFMSEIESRNVPVVFTGCVKDCKAFSKWNVLNGGLQYLQDLAGCSVVEAMLSRSAPIFYGDIRSHERVQLPFATFIGYCKDLLQHVGDRSEFVHQSGVFEQCTAFGSGNESPQEIYLAQVPILNPEKKDVAQLECLKEDIEMPVFLEGKEMDSVNLWMNCTRTRSSTHYDPHHNLLCILSGYKQVSLWPPSATPFLYPLPLYGEASNHSAIPLENPDFSRYPRAKSLDRFSQKVDLHPGDAVFIPEGWFHQVNSADLTIAVNFWWRSDKVSGMLEHMDSYYLRRILKRLTDKEMDRMLPRPETSAKASATDDSHQLITSNTGNLECDSPLGDQKGDVKAVLEHRISVNEMEPETFNSFHELVSLIHVHVDKKNIVDSSSQSLAEKEGTDMGDTGSLFNLDEDPIANMIWKLDPHACQRIFLAMAHNFPRTLEAFILQALSPVGAEVLTRKFEQMDQIMMAEEWGKFYQIFYGVFDDQSSAMAALLDGKESFARQVFKNVLAQHLGVNVNGAEPVSSSRDQ